MTDIPQSESTRQGSRVVMRVPVEVRAINADGSALDEATHTGVVGSMGAMVLLSRELPIGREVQLTNRFSQQTASFRVAWVRPQPDGKLWETGIESVRPLDGFWGVRFPPKTDNS